MSYDETHAQDKIWFQTESRSDVRPTTVRTINNFPCYLTCLSTLSMKGITASKSTIKLSCFPTQLCISTPIFFHGNEIRDNFVQMINIVEIRLFRLSPNAITCLRGIKWRLKFDIYRIPKNTMKKGINLFPVCLIIGWNIFVMFEQMILTTLSNQS